VTSSGLPTRGTPSSSWRPWIAATTAIGLGAPVTLYLWFVLHFGVNVPIQDTWNGTLPLLLAFTRGHLTLAGLWAAHNENRELFPNLILVLLDSGTHMNEVVDMVVGAGLLSCAAGVVLWLTTRTLRLPLPWLIPVPWLLLGLAQVENTLWAYQFAWMLIIFLAAATLALIELAPSRPALVAAAVVLALIASFSSLQGLLLWPVGLVYGLACGWRRRRALIWTGIGVVAGVVYAWHIGPVYPTPHPSYMLDHPVLAVRFYLLLVGSIFTLHHTVFAALLLGLALYLVGIFAFSRRSEWARLRLPLALVLTALLFDVVVTEGRVQFGLAAAGASRYTSYNLILLTGVYLAAVAAADPNKLAKEWSGITQRTLLTAAPLALAALLVVVQLGWGVPQGLYQGQVYLVNRTIGSQLLRNFRQEPAARLGLYLFYPEGPYVKEWAPVLERYHWSTFSSPG
jgi:hypothetical protein